MGGARHDWRDSPGELTQHATTSDAVQDWVWHGFPSAASLQTLAPACREVLTTVMRKHQRYFPVQEPGTGKLLPFFITVANGVVDVPAVRAGNEAVLTARFEDARFFYTSDLRRTLAEHRCAGGLGRRGASARSRRRAVARSVPAQPTPPPSR